MLEGYDRSPLYSEIPCKTSLRSGLGLVMSGLGLVMSGLGLGLVMSGLGLGLVMSGLGLGLVMSGLGLGLGLQWKAKKTPNRRFRFLNEDE